MKIKPPHIAFSLLFLSWLLDYLFPQYRFIKGNYRFIGIAALLAGLSLTFSSFYLFKKNKTPILPGRKPAFMVAEGAYKFTRNPMYLGVTTALFGFSVYFGNILSFLAPIMFFLIINLKFIPFEEKLMGDIFGRKYISYKNKVRRWI